MHLDLASLRSVRAFASAFLREEPHLHLLINNAGVSAGGTTEDGFSLAFQVNHLGHFLLTELLLERLRSCAPSRVVIVASSAHRAARLRLDTLGSPSPGPLGAFQDYCDSKLANVLHARGLAARLRGTGVTCYAAHPGRDMVLRVLSSHGVSPHGGWPRVERGLRGGSLCTAHPWHEISLWTLFPPLQGTSLCTAHPWRETCFCIVCLCMKHAFAQRVLHETCLCIVCLCMCIPLHNTLLA